jgi:hypothetical protein
VSGPSRAAQPDGRGRLAVARPVTCPAACDLRCGCGSLLARRTRLGIELKCRRCKRTIVLRFEEV